jgi:flagellar M-ring protein FliF
VNPEQLLAHLKRLGSTLTPRQLATLAGAFVAVVAIVAGSAYWVNAPTYTLLFADMDSESANAVVTKLKADKVQYVLDEGGRSVRVASDRADELRLSFASSGMPTTGRIGFEIFDRTAFGTTEFLEHVNYRRALEGELARTIGTISEVSSARVHIAMAKDSLMVGESQPAKASVVLKLRNSKPLAPATVAGIASLVAASVESLRPEAVVIVDTFGRPLSQKPDDADDPGSGLQLDKQRRLEKELSARVVSLIEPVVGAGRVRVNVAARLVSESAEQTEERFDPETVLKSRQTTTDIGSTAGGTQIAAGARANIPPNSSTASTGPQTATPSTQTASRSTENTTYEVSKVTTHRILPRGQVERLSVAVVLDDERTATKDAKTGKVTVANKPVPPADIQRIQKLVASSVGLDLDRGDQLTVENIAFDDQNLDDTPTGNWFQRNLTPLTNVGGNAFNSLWRFAAVIIIAWFAFSMIIKPITARAIGGELMPAPIAEMPEAVGAGAGVRTVADLEGEIEAELEAGVLAKAADNRRLAVMTKRIAKVAEQEPEHVAQLVRTWLTDEER